MRSQASDGRRSARPRGGAGALPSGVRCPIGAIGSVLAAKFSRVRERAPGTARPGSREGILQAPESGTS